MLLSAGFFHCKSQKVKGVYSLILLEKIKVQTRKLAIDSSKYDLILKIMTSSQIDLG